MTRSAVCRIGLIPCLLLGVGCGTVPKAPDPPPAPPQTTLQVGDTTVLAVSPPAKACCAHPTLIDFLGVQQVAEGVGGLVHKIGGGITSRLAMFFPGLEPKPPLLMITDPANSSEAASPAVQQAAAIKKEEDGAKQKVKALRYLATIGCGGCYGGVEEAFLAALEDCTEEVRYEAVKALRETAGSPCTYCKADSCCSPKILQALTRLSEEQDDAGCFKEPSERVRRVARLAMRGCGGVVVEESPEQESTDVPLEGPTEAEARPRDANVEVAENAETASDEDDVRKASLIAAPDAATSPHQAQRIGVAATNSWSDERGERTVAKVNGQSIYLREITTTSDTDGQEESGSSSQEIVQAGWNSPTDSGTPRERLMSAIDDELVCQHVLRRLPGGDGRTTHDTSGHAEDRRRRARQWLLQLVQVDPHVTAEQVQRFYSAHVHQFRAPDQVRWEQLSIRHDTGIGPEAARATMVYFRDIARRREGSPPDGYRPEAVLTQRFAWRSRDDIGSPRLADALFELAVGETSDIIEDERGLYLVRLLERRPGRPMPIEAVSDLINRRVLEQRRREAEQVFVNRLRATAQIWIDESVLSSQAEHGASRIGVVP